MSRWASHGRLAITAAVAFVAGLALGRGCVPEDLTGPPHADERPTAVRVPPESHTDQAPRTRTRDRAVRADAGGPDDATTETLVLAAPPISATTAAAAPDDEFPFVDVEVVDAEGNAVDGALVYAHPAGTGGDETVTPRAPTQDSGVARLHVIARGRYDIGAMLDLLHVLVLDIDVPRAERVRLTLPRDGLVTFRFPVRPLPASDQEADDDDSRYHIGATLEDGVRAQFPARGEVLDSGVDAPMEPGESEWGVRLPLGARFRAVHSDDFRAEPETFTAPAEVRIVPAMRHPVFVRIEWGHPTRTYRRPTDLTIEFLWGDGDSARTDTWTAHLDANVPVGTDGEEAGFNTFVVPSSGTLRWRGSGVVPGSTQFCDLSTTRRTAIVANVELDPRIDPPQSSPPPDLEPHSERVFRAEPAEAVAGSWFEVWFVDLAEGEEPSMFGAVEGSTLHGSVTNSMRSVIAHAGEWVSRRVCLPEDAATDVVLRLERGGYLVLVPERMPPENLVTPRIERTDGVPMWANGSICRSAEVSLGLRLGPFAPGRVEFQVTLARRVVAKFAGDVAAGVNTPLVIPRLRASDVAAPK